MSEESVRAEAVPGLRLEVRAVRALSEAAEGHRDGKLKLERSKTRTLTATRDSKMEILGKRSDPDEFLCETFRSYREDSDRDGRFAPYKYQGAEKESKRDELILNFTKVVSDCRAIRNTDCTSKQESSREAQATPAI